MGTPRCGSTLAERVLIASGKALPLGELGTFPRLLRRLALELGAPARDAGGDFEAAADPACYLERLLRLPSSDAREKVRGVGKAYVETARLLCAHEHGNEITDDAVLLVDKQLDTHLHLALLRAALPGAAIIWCARDARDAALSQFFHSFEAEHDPRAYDYTYSLQGLAARHANTADLLAHFLATVPRLGVLRRGARVVPVSILFSSLLLSLGPTSHVAAHGAAAMFFVPPRSRRRRDACPRGAATTVHDVCPCGAATPVYAAPQVRAPRRRL